MYQLTTLSSGLRVASEQLPGVESVAVAVSVGVGARHESQAQNGVAHLLEHMAFKGTARRSARQIAEEFDMIGGQFNAYTSAEQTVYYAKVLKESLPLAVDILADILQHSQFDAGELKREQGVVLQEIAAHNDTPDDVIFDLFDEKAFPNQPMGRSILGPAEQVAAFTRGDLLGYMCAHYHPSRMVVSAAGNVAHEALVALAERHFTELSGTSIDAPEPGRWQGGDNRKKDDLEQLQFLLGFAGVSVHDTDFYAASLYSNILGGGMSSRLFQEVREKRGLAYHVSSMMHAYADCGVMAIYTATSAESSAQLPQLLMQEVRKMTDAVTDAELLRAKNQQKAELLMAKESPGTVAGWIGKHLLRFGRYKTLEEIVQAIDAVSKDDIRRVGERILSCKTPTMAALGPVGKLPGYEAVVAS